MSHLKNNYIFGILQSRPTIWHTFKQISSTFNFWPPYNPMGSFWSPVFQNAQWCQSGISLFACQDMSKSQKQQKYCNYTRLPSPKFILLFVNSTMGRDSKFSVPVGSKIRPFFAILSMKEIQLFNVLLSLKVVKFDTKMYLNFSNFRGRTSAGGGGQALVQKRGQVSDGGFWQNFRWWG